MKLVYCWMENYLGVENQGFNFGSEYIYSQTWDKINESLAISRSKNENYIPDYFKIGGQGFENVTAIVGENGAGKSRFIDKILKIITEKSIFKNCVLLFEDSGDIKIISNGLSVKFNSKTYDSNVQSIDDAIIFYSPEYTFKDDFSLGGTILNISSPQILRNDIFKQQIENIDIIHKSNEIIRGIDFINNIVQNEKKGISNFLPFDLPKYLNLKIYEDNGYLKWDLEFEIKGYTSDPNSIPNDNLKKLQEIFNEANDIYKLNVSYFNKFLLYYFKKVCEILNNRILASSGITIVNDIKESDLKTYVAAQIGGLQKCTLSNGNEFHSYRYLEIFNRYEAHFESHSLFQIDLFKKVEIDGTSKLIANQLVHDYIILTSDFEIRESLISIYWDGISSGEMAFLQLFSRFYSISTSILEINEFKNLYIFIDEGELGFHVRWQQKYLEYLRKGLCAIFPNCKLQLILATHSPIVLSDFPKDHVIFLQKPNSDNKIAPYSVPKTFAANIHDILKSDFFMDKGFLGSYVTEKINEVIYFLNCLSFDMEIIKNKIKIATEEKAKKYLDLKPNKDKTIDYEELKNLKLFENSSEGKEYPYLMTFISNIDEPILKIKLTEMYHKAIGGTAEEGRLLAQQEIIRKRLEELNPTKK